LKKCVRLSVLSPVFIGDEKGERSPLEYYLEQKAYVYVISEGKLLRALKEKNRLKDFLTYLEQEDRPNMNRFFSQLGPQQSSVLRDATLRKIKTGVSNLSNLRLHMMDPMTGEPYIPGTSIKGSLRLALLYYLASKDTKNFVNRVEQAVEKEKNKKKAGKGIDTDYFQRYKIVKDNRSDGNPRNDILRMLKVSDAFVRIQSRTDYISEVYQVKVISLNNDNGGYHFSRAGNREINIYVEAIQPGMRFEFDIDIDEFLENIFKSCGFTGKMNEQLMQALGLKYGNLLDEERSFFEKAGLKAMVNYCDMLKKSGANFRLGWGSGMLNTTAAMLLPGEVRRKIRGRYFKPRNNVIFPQSRKVVVSGNGSVAHMMGWCKLEFV